MRVTANSVVCPAALAIQRLPSPPEQRKEDLRCDSRLPRYLVKQALGNRLPALLAQEHPKHLPVIVPSAPHFVLPGSHVLET